MGTISKITYPILKSYQKVGIGNGGIYTTENNITAGAIFIIPFPCQKVTFTLKHSSMSGGELYCQYGRCTENASFPSVIETGAGRESYQACTAAGDYEININGIASIYIFIGGHDFDVSNIKCIIF